jgi:hypothetical protein
LKTKTPHIPLFPLAALAVSLALSACPAEPDDSKKGLPHGPYGNPPYTGPANGTAASASADELIEWNSASITIHLTLEEGYIKTVTFDQVGHTADRGIPIIEKARNDIVAKNEIKIPVVDVVGYASVTPTLINRAGQQALAAIPGYTPD